MEILGFDIPLWTLLATGLALWLYWYLYSGFNYFSKRGIPHVTPVYPFVGNLWGVWKRDIRKWQVDNVKNYGKVFGMFDGTTPLLYVSDPEIIRSIFVKEFECFTDHQLFSTGLDHKYTRKFLFVVNGEEWKDIRSSVTPAFSSGKIKKVSNMMVECSKRMVEDTKEVARKDGTVELKNLFGKVTLDVIATCAFGTKLDNLSDPDNPFVQNSEKAFRPSLFNTAWSLIPELFPWTQIFGLEMFISGSSIDFFAKMVEEIIKTRKAEGSNNKRGDFLDVLLEEAAKEEAKRKVDPSAKTILTDEVLVSQCVTFFAAGFDTVGTALAVTAHYLALYPECQEKLFEEINSVMDKHKELNHESIQECHYLNQVLEESLRIFPTDTIIERACTKSCEIKGVKFEKGETVVIPMWAIQHDPKYHPNPEVFDPDRFAPENKAKMTPYTYFPFGQGPRVCIGMRFAMEESKLALGHLIHAFKLSKCGKTSVPFKTEGNRVISMPVDMFVKVEERKEE